MIFFVSTFVDNSVVQILIIAVFEIKLQKEVEVCTKG